MNGSISVTKRYASLILRHNGLTHFFAGAARPVGESFSGAIFGNHIIFSRQNYMVVALFSVFPDHFSIGRIASCSNLDNQKKMDI